MVTKRLISTFFVYKGTVLGLPRDESPEKIFKSRRIHRRGSCLIEKRLRFNEPIDQSQTTFDQID